MREAREAGWYVKVLYVRVPIKTAIQRAMLRTRRVSPERIAMYQAKISQALVIAAKARAPCAHAPRGPLFGGKRGVWRMVSDASSAACCRADFAPTFVRFAAAQHADEVETVDSSYDLQQQVMLFQSDVSLIAGI